MRPLFPALERPLSRTALRFGESSLTYAELTAAADALAERVAPAGRVALWANASPHTAVGVLAALRAGVPVIPLNPRSGERELTHILRDGDPATVLAAADIELPRELAGLPRTDIDPGARAAPRPVPEPSPDRAALIMYTSGTTGPPKGAVIPRRALAHTLDDLAEVWRWTSEDVLVHALPLFHVHGLVLGLLGPLRRGGRVHHLEKFTTAGVARELMGSATMLFGVPTMYHRLAEEVGGDAFLARALGKARLLVSGSAPLSRRDHTRLTEATGQHVVERYGLTETLINTSVRLAGPGNAPGTVGPPLPSVGLRLVDESGALLTRLDGESLGEVQVCGPNVFTEYLGRPEATAAAFTGDGWFRTGDMATRDEDGAVRLVGRASTDIIKSGGYKIGAGEIENVLLEHPEISEAAVTGEADDDLGERVVAWIVPAHARRPPTERDVTDHVARALARHKRPRTVRVVDALPRNDLGKVMKRALTS